MGLLEFSNQIKNKHENWTSNIFNSDSTDAF
jgi:hypothetical protein